MTLTIELPTELEREVVRRAAAEGKDLSTFVAEAVTDKIAEPCEESPTVGEASHDAFMARLRSIIAMHPRAGANMDDSRESIYAGRGE